MQLKIDGVKVWLATEPVDFRKAANGLRAIVDEKFERKLGNEIYVFINRSKTAVKILGYHRNGTMLISKKLDKKRYYRGGSEEGLIELGGQTLSWLLAGLDWEEMSKPSEEGYQDYY